MCGSAASNAVSGAFNLGGGIIGSALGVQKPAVPKAPTPLAQRQMPTMGQTQRRRTLLAGTNVTQGSAQLGANQTTRKTLLGQ